MEFNYTKLIFSFVLKWDVNDRYHFFRISREFASAFRQTVECEGKDDEKCSKADKCPYELLFSQELSSNPYAVKRYQKPPLPFVFDLPIVPPAPNRGCELQIGLTLAGKAVNFILDFLVTVKNIFGQSSGGVFNAGKLIRIDSEDYLGSRTVISSDGKEVETNRFSIHSMQGLEKMVILPIDSVTLSFITPLRIIKDGFPVKELSFSVLAMALLRRMSSMAFYYCSMELDLNFKGLSLMSEDIAISNNEFSWVEWGLNQAGIIGKGTFCGNLVDFHSCLLFGEQFHVGKRAAYGLGLYRLERIG